MITPHAPSRRLVVRTSEGQYGIIGIECAKSIDYPSYLPTPDPAIIARLVRVTDQYVMYQEESSDVALALAP